MISGLRQCFSMHGNACKVFSIVTIYVCVCVRVCVCVCEHPCKPMYGGPLVIQLLGTKFRIKKDENKPSVCRGVERGVSRASGNPLQFSVYNKVSAVAAN